MIAFILAMALTIAIGIPEAPTQLPEPFCTTDWECTQLGYERGYDEPWNVLDTEPGVQL